MLAEHFWSDVVRGAYSGVGQLATATLVVALASDVVGRVRVIFLTVTVWVELRDLEGRLLYNSYSALAQSEVCELDMT